MMRILTRLWSPTMLLPRRQLVPVSLSIGRSRAGLTIASREMLSIGRRRHIRLQDGKLTPMRRGSNDDKQNDLMDLT
jgi:hypothetical protein